MKEEQKIKISNKLKGIKRPPFSKQHRDNLSKSHLGKKLSEEHKLNISRGNLGRIVSPETRAKIGKSNSIALLGRKLPIRQIEKMKGRRNSIKTEFKKGFKPWNSGTSTPEKKAISRRNAILKNKYNINIEIYNEMLKNQGYKCCICGGREEKKSSSGGICNLHIDHDHKTGKVRGLLCHKCNAGIGMFRENIETMEKAIKYLKSF